MQEYKKQETEFKKLHQQLLDLKLYDLATNFSTNFWNYGHNKFVDGIDIIKEINNL